MNVGALTVTLGANTAGMLQGLKAAEAAMKKLERSVLNSQQVILGSFNKMNRSMQSFGLFKVYQPVQEEAKKTERVISQTSASAVQSFEKVGNSIRSLSQSLRSFGWLATTTLTLPLIGVAKAAGGMAMNFEFSMKKMINLAGVSKEEIAGLNDEVKTLSKTTGIGAPELAETLYYIESSGLKGTKALQALDSSAKAAMSGMGDAKDMANLLTAALNAYADEGLTAIRFMNVLTATIREGKAEPAQMVTAFGSILPIAQKLGIGVEEIGGAMAVMTRVTTSTANSATYLRNVLFKLLDPTPEVQEAMEQMGLSVEGVQNMLKTKGFNATMRELESTTAKYGTTLATLFPELRALLGALNYTGQNAEEVDRVMRSVNESTGDFNKNVAEMTDTFRTKFNKILQEIKIPLQEFGDILLNRLEPILKSWAERISNLIKWFNSLNKTTQEGIIRFAGFLTVIGPLSLVLATFGNAIATVVGWVTKLNTVLKITTLVSNPIAWLIGGVAAVTTGIISYTKKINEAARANSDLHKELVNVNGELKSLADLSDIDMSSMTGMQLWKAMEDTQKIYQKYRNQAIDAAKKSGLSEEELFSGMLPQDKMTLWQRINPFSPATQTKYLNQQIDLANEAKEKYNQAKEAFENWTNTFGSGATTNNIDAASGSLNKLRSELDKLADSSKAIKPISKKEYMAALGYGQLAGKPKMPLGYLNKDTEWDIEERVRVMEELNAELDYNIQKENALTRVSQGKKDLFNKITADINAYSRALEDLLRVKEEDRDNAWFIDYNAVVEGLTKMQEEATKLEKLKNIADTLTDAFSEFFRSTIHGFKNFGETILSMLEDLVIKIIARIVVLKLLELFTGQKFDTLSFVMNQELKVRQQTQTQTPQEGYAKGGVVPRGYLNDSYNARLTSGEIVFPNFKSLTTAIGNIGMQREQEVVFRIEGDTLVGILNKQNKRSNII